MDDRVFAELKGIAAAEGRPMGAVIEDALRESLARRRQQADRFPVRLPTFSGTGTMPGVDLDSNATLLELMEEEGNLAELKETV